MLSKGAFHTLGRNPAALMLGQGHVARYFVCVAFLHLGVPAILRDRAEICPGSLNTLSSKNAVVGDVPINYLYPAAIFNTAHGNGV